MRHNFPVSIPPWPVLTLRGTWVKCDILLVNNWEPSFDRGNSLNQAGLVDDEELKRAFNHPAAQQELCSLLSLERAVEVQKEIQSSAVNIHQHFNLLHVFQETDTEFMVMKQKEN